MFYLVKFEDCHIICLRDFMGKDNPYIDSELSFGICYSGKNQLQLPLKNDAGFLQNHPLQLGDRSFFIREGIGGWWDLGSTFVYKSHDPPQLTNFFTWPPLEQ